MSFGQSNSKSSQAQTTTNSDARVVADAGAAGVSGSGNNVTVTSTDSGLVGAAFDYLKAADAAITDRQNALLATAGNAADAVLKSGQQAGSDAVSAAVNTLTAIKQATTGQGTFDNSTIIAALVGAVALIATAK